ncbi:unnamed protein product [Rotaria sp. Silwood2]|nr:unnamed protein product [Rotaria sp. Silwood2]
MVSFDSFEQCVIKLQQLTHFKVVARVKDMSDLMNGTRWEQLMLRTRISKFNFRFKYNSSKSVIRNQDNNSLLDSFRSPFWLEQKRWFVACHKETLDSALNVYSVPEFRPHHVFFYHNNSYPPLSTAPPRIEQQSFYNSNIDLVVKFSESITPPLYHFSQVDSLRLLGSTLPSVSILMSYVDLHRIKKLDVSNISTILVGELHSLFDHTPQLYHFTLKILNPLFVLPRQLRSCKLENNGQSIDVDQFCSICSSIEHLDITVESKEIMIALIDRLEHLESIVFRLGNVAKA